MADSPKVIKVFGKSRPLPESRVERGGINKNPSAALSRPAPPQPYKPTATGTTTSKTSG